jgi:site-specific DNA recombinase
MSPDKSSKPLRAAVYARQSVKVDEGIAEQVKVCTAVAETAHGWEVVKVYRDNNTSASSERGEGTDWAKMIADFDAGAFDVLVAVTVDRLLRRVADVVDLRKSDREGGRKKDVRIVTTRDGIDTATPMGNSVLTILVALAEGEIEAKKARMIPYAINRRAAGHPWPGRVPYGYKWVPEIQRDGNETRWAVVSDEAMIVRRMHKEFKTNGGKLAQIAAGLNADNVPSPSGKKWGSPTVRRLLLSPFHAALLPPVQGWAAFKPELVNIENCTAGAWEPIVSVDVFRLTQRKLLEDGRRTNPEGTARKWLLSGLARCGKCSALVRSASTREGHHGYRCPTGHFLRRGEILDAFVTVAVLNRLSRPDAKILLTPPKTGPDMATLVAIRSSLDERERQLAETIAAGMSAVAAAPSLAKIKDEREAVGRQIAALVTTDPMAEIVGAVDAKEVWERLSLGAQRSILAALAVVVISPVGKGVKTTIENVHESVGVAWVDWAGKSQDPWLHASDTRSGPLSEIAAEEVASAAR